MRCEITRDSKPCDSPATLALVRSKLHCNCNRKPVVYACQPCYDDWMDRPNAVHCSMCGGGFYARDGYWIQVLPVARGFVDPLRKEEARAV